MSRTWDYSLKGVGNQGARSRHHGIARPPPPGMGFSNVPATREGTYNSVPGEHLNYSYAEKLFSFLDDDPCCPGGLPDFVPEDLIRHGPKPVRGQIYEYKECDSGLAAFIRKCKETRATESPDTSSTKQYKLASMKLVESINMDTKYNLECGLPYSPYPMSLPEHRPDHVYEYFETFVVDMAKVLYAENNPMSLKDYAEDFISDYRIEAAYQDGFKNGSRHQYKLNISDRDAKAMSMGWEDGFGTLMYYLKLFWETQSPYMKQFSLMHDFLVYLKETQKLSIRPHVEAGRDSLEKKLEDPKLEPEQSTITTKYAVEYAKQLHDRAVQQQSFSQYMPDSLSQEPDFSGQGDHVLSNLTSSSTNNAISRVENKDASEDAPEDASVAPQGSKKSANKEQTSLISARVHSDSLSGGKKSSGSRTDTDDGDNDEKTTRDRFLSEFSTANPYDVFRMVASEPMDIVSVVSDVKSATKENADSVIQAQALRTTINVVDKIPNPESSPPIDGPSAHPAVIPSLSREIVPWVSKSKSSFSSQRSTKSESNSQSGPIRQPYIKPCRRSRSSSTKKSSSPTIAVPNLPCLLEFGQASSSHLLAYSVKNKSYKKRYQPFGGSLDHSDGRMDENWRNSFCGFSDDNK